MIELLQEAYRYAVENQGEFRFALLQHVRLVAVALGIGQPADAFVNELVGGDDMVRQLGLVRVASAMAALPPHFQLNGQPTVAGDQNLREALSRLLRTNAPALVVLDNQQPVGLLTLAAISAAAHQSNQAAGAEEAEPVGAGGWQPAGRAP